MKTLKALFGVAAVAMLTTTAFAGDDTDTKSSTAKFDKLDKDHDGKVSKAEAKGDSTLTAEFASVDQDSDGYVTETEYAAMAESAPNKGMEQRSSDYSREP
jgi:Ca2+-binding EF-hand superfamily protein